MKKRYVSIVVALALLTGLVSCNSNPNVESSGKESSTQAVSSGGDVSQEADSKGSVVDGIYHYNEPVHVKANAFYRPDYMSSPADKWIFKWAEDKMNIVFDVEGVPESSIWEQLSLMFASGELPDALLTYPNLGNKQANVKYGDTEGQLVAIDEYMTAENMPYLTALFEEQPELLKYVCTPEGHFYAMPEMFEDQRAYPTASAAPYSYNQKWFSAVGYETAPTDVYEMREALRKIKEQDPGNVGTALVPWGGVTSNSMPLLPFYNAFGFYGFNDDLISFLDASYLSGGKMVAVGLTDNYYAYLQFVSSLYKEGLIDQDLYTLDADQAAAHALNGDYGTVPSWSAATAVPDIMDWEGLYPLTSDYSDVQKVPGYMYSYSSLLSICAGASDETIDACLRFADVHYNPDYKYMCVYGPNEGDDTYGLFSGPTWEWKDYDGTVKPNNLLIGTEFEDWVDQLEKVSLLSWSGSCVDRRSPDKNWYNYDKSDPKERGAAIYKESNAGFIFPFYEGGVFTEDDANRIADLKSPLEEYFKTETAKFITGARELNDSEWEKFQQDLKDRGYEEYLQMQLDNYNETYGN